MESRWVKIVNIVPTPLSSLDALGLNLAWMLLQLTGFGGESYGRF